MKIIRFPILLMLILTLTLVIASCGSSQAIEKSIAHKVENQFDNLENRIENPNADASSSVGESTTADAPQEFESATLPVEAQTKCTEHDRHKPPALEVSLAREEAESIVLGHAGVALSNALYLHTELELDDGIPVYEVEFCVDIADSVEHLAYEYAIHANSGEILEFECEIDR